MRYLSLFSGIEAASVAWHPLGWECVGVAEVEPFPCKVLAHHFPDVPNLGDIAKIAREQIEALGHIDLIVGGFPCQDLSIAGKRKGLRDENGAITRSGLFYTAMQIVEWADPRWVVLENVLGMFSSNSGADFASVVGELAGCGFDVPKNKWRNAGVVAGPRGLVEWVTLDAQYIRTQTHPRAVPQRRRRVFLVRDSGNWAGRPPLFLESESLRGNPPPSRKARQDVAGTIAKCSFSGGAGGRPEGAAGNHFIVYPDTARCVTTGEGARLDGESCNFVVAMPQDKIAATINTFTDPTAQFIAFTARDYGADAAQGVTPTMRSLHKSEDGHQCGAHGLAVAIGLVGDETPKHSENVASTMRSQQGGEGYSVMTPARQVRRLTPLECERLQGFPDNWTNIPGASDTVRYKALGNSMATNVMHYLGQKINDHH